MTRHRGAGMLEAARRHEHGLVPTIRPYAEARPRHAGPP